MCIICTNQKSYKLDEGIMITFVSEKNRPLLLAKGVETAGWSFPFSVHDNNLYPTNKIKVLGVKMDDRLNFESHVTDIYNHVFRQIAFI